MDHLVKKFIENSFKDYDYLFLNNKIYIDEDYIQTIEDLFNYDKEKTINIISEIYKDEIFTYSDVLFEDIKKINIKDEIENNEIRIAKILNRSGKKYLKSQDYEKAMCIINLAWKNHIHQVNIFDKFSFQL